jgi:4-amino-4-deoxy-L-arabinose transferase-like glycosyltransferase
VRESDLPEVSESRARLILLAVFALALGLRLWGITFGLPYEYQISEQMYVGAAQSMASAGYEKIKPLFGTYQILLLGAHEALTPLLAAVGLGPRLAATLGEPTVFNLLGRLLSAVLGALTVLPMYWIGRRLWNRAAGLLAALFLAVAYIHVVNSHYAKPDATVLFLASLVFLLCLRIAEAGRLRDYALAGLLAGLAVTAKPLAFPLVMTIALSHLQRAAGERELPAGFGARLGWTLRGLLDGRLLLAAGLTLVAMFATSPQLLTRRAEVLELYKWLAEAGAGGGMFRFDIHFGQPAWRVYLSTLFWGLGALLAALAFGALLVYLIRRRPRPLVPLLVFPVVLLVFLLWPGQYVHSRYILLTLPVALVCAAGLTVEAAARLRARPAFGRFGPVFVGVAVLAAVAHPAVSSVLHDRLLTREDTRTLAKKWIEENLPEGTRVALEVFLYSPQLSSAKKPTPFSPRSYDVVTTGVYGLSEKSKRAGKTEGDVTIEDYVADGVQYVVTQGHNWALKRLDPEEERQRLAFYEDLADKGYLVQDFSPYRKGKTVPFIFDQVYGPTVGLLGFERPGPPIRIFLLPTATGPDLIVAPAAGPPPQPPSGSPPG